MICGNVIHSVVRFLDADGGGTDSCSAVCSLEQGHDGWHRGKLEPHKLLLPSGRDWDIMWPQTRVLKDDDTLTIQPGAIRTKIGD